MFKDVLNNKFFETVNTIVNYTVLNFIFLITCIPVFTIGAATAALCEVLLHETRGEYGYIVKPYFTAFGRNFKKATPAFLILAAIGFAFTCSAYYYWFNAGFSGARALAVFLLILLAIWHLTFSWTFPLIARFENTTKNTLGNAFRIVFLHFKQSLGILALDAAFAALTLISKEFDIFMLTCGFALLAFFKCHFYNKVLRPYEEAARCFIQ